MMMLQVHSQLMMSNRIDVICTNCTQRMVHFPKVPLSGINKCTRCGLIMTDVLKLYTSEEHRFYWHFFKRKKFNIKEG